MTEVLPLGQIITGPAEKDAIHIAVAPLMALETLQPGQHVGVDGECADATATPVGIVDPYLRGPVLMGERFYLFLYPNTIRSLRHEWKHPAFSEPEQVPGIEVGAVREGARAWLRSFAEHEADLPYEELLEGAKNYLEHGQYLIDGGKWEGFRLPRQFWTMYELVSGTDVPQEERGSFFSCSC